MLTSLSHTLKREATCPHCTFTRNFIHDSHLLDIHVSLINADGRNAAADPRLGRVIHQTLPFPLSRPAPHRKGLGTKLPYSYTAKSYVLNQTWLGSDTDLFTFRYRCAVIRCNTTFWQLSDSKSKYMSDSKCNRMCNSSVD